MGILRYTASADTTIVNAYEANLRTRGTGAKWLPTGPPAASELLGAPLSS